MHKVTWATTTFLCAIALGLAGCSSASDGDQDAEAGQPFTPKPKGGIPGGLLPEELALWQYDAASGDYEAVDGDASQPYQVNLRKPSKPISIAYDDGYGGIPFTVQIKKNLERLAAEYDITLFYCDAQFKPEKAVDCAQQQATKNPDFVIESNFQTGAAAAVMKIWDEARIPAVSVEVFHPNAVFFGSNNYEVGRTGGQEAGEFAKSEWDCKDLTVLYGENPGEGEAANQRGAGFIDGVQEVCGTLPEDRIETILLDAGSTDQGITKGTDWLTANPQAEHILATSIDDARTVGLGKAFRQNGRDGYAVGIGCDDIGIAELKAGPASETRTLGCVAYFPEKYPEYLLSIAMDVLEGKPVPQEIHFEHLYLDQESVGDYY